LTVRQRSHTGYRTAADEASQMKEARNVAQSNSPRAELYGRSH
jgi:hypothetical protein